MQISWRGIFDMVKLEVSWGANLSFHRQETRERGPAAMPCRATIKQPYQFLDRRMFENAVFRAHGPRSFWTAW